MTLYDHFRHRILAEILEETRQISSNFIVIIDKKSLGILSGSISVLDLTERGAIVIEQLEKPRKPLPEVDVLYLLTPTHKSVSKLLEDFVKIPYYQQVHLYFTGHLPDNLMRQLASSNIVPYIKTFKEANCGFRLIGRECFSLECSNILSNIYLCRSPSERKDLVYHLSRNLSSVCGIMSDLPYVCFQSNSLPAQELGLALEQCIEDLYRSAPSLRINDTRPVMIILDRNYDISIPLIHDVHYEALLKDLYEVGPDGNVIYQSVDNSNNTTTKDAIINEFDELWTKLRYLEIDESQGKLNEELKLFRSNNLVMEKASKQEHCEDLKAIAKVASGLSEYNQKVSKFAVHRYLIDACLKIFSEEKINEISEIEQMILTGFDTEKKIYKEADLLRKIREKLDNIRNPKEKLRLVMLLLTGVNLNQDDRSIITDMIPSNLALQLTKLSNFGISLQTNEKTTKKLEKSYINELQNKIPTITKIFNYAIPRIYDIINAALNNTLESEGFLFGKSAPSALGDIEPVVQVQSLRKKQNPTHRSKRKIILFVIGGVSYAEIRAVAEFPDAHVIIGGSRIFSPLEFVEEIIEMSRDSDNLDIDPRDVELDFS